MPFVFVDGLRTFYESTGKGHPILFIHGSACNHSVWRYQLDYFGERYRATAIDLMGHGKSEISIPASPISINRYADLVNSFLEVLNIEKATLVGQSLGGAVCIQLCLNFPQKVECLGLINTGAKLGVDPQWLSMLRENFRGALETGFKNILGQKHEGIDIGDANWVMKEVLTINPAIGLADFEACNKFDSREQLAQISNPTLIIGGSEDMLTPPWFQQYLHEKIENSTLEIIEGVGHLSMTEKPQRFNTLLFEFLKRHL